ncbi:MAG: DUF1493 family protein [Janthinobacterium lividum]
MERQEILIRFADLRRLAVAVPAYITERVDEQSPSFKTRIEDDLGCSGDDMVELLEKFSKTYYVDVANFDFTGLISPEGGDVLGCLLAAAYFLVGWLLKTLAGLLCWPFDSQLAQHLWQQHVPAFWRPANAQPKPLNIGDFVASAAVGQFVRREQVYFRLVR